MTTEYFKIPMSNQPNLIELGVKPGWFLRAGCCLIWFEIQEVFSGTCILAASRDPKKVTELYMMGDFFSSITDVCSGLPSGHWIKLNREKNFRDKFFPNDTVIAKATGESK